MNKFTQYFLLASLLSINNFSFAADCVTASRIDWVRVGETETIAYNNNKSGIVVRTSKDKTEHKIYFGMNLDDVQGAPLLGVLSAAMALGQKVTLRDNLNTNCASFSEIVVHSNFPIAH